LLLQNLYQEENITDVDVKDYLKRLVESIASSYDSGDRIRFELDLESLQLDVDQLVPVGLIANELVCNAVKYAFDEGVEGTIGISLSSTDTDYRLQVRDDGKGLPTPELVVKKHSLGTRLIKSFVDRLDGRLEVDNQQGTTVTITWPKNQSS
jgi:two-component sensor histidine kinase